MSVHTSTRITECPAGEVIVLSFVQKRVFDEQITNEVAEEFVELTRHRLALIDFDSLDALGSAALSKLISLNSKMREAGGQLKMFGMPGPVRKLVALMKLDKLFDIHETEAEALEAFH